MKKNLNALILGAAVSLLGSLTLPAADTETSPSPGVRYVHRHTTEPREIDMHIEGMTYEEVAVVLKEFGAVDAIAFDGGGSATLVMADGKDGEPKVLNRPSDGQERAVGNSLGVMIRPPLVAEED